MTALGQVAVASAQAVPWPSAAAVHAVTRELRDRPPLVDLASCTALRARLADAARGRALVLQAGDCAEMFHEVTPHATERKCAQLELLGQAMTGRTGLPAVLIGRMAGQFAKPRSYATEPGPDGVPIPVYRGDAVNSAAPDPLARVADPRRMLAAYTHSAAVLDHLSARRAAVPVWASHEALLPEYEEPLVRQEHGTRYAASGHLLWVGERTRSVRGPQVRLLADVANPVGVKLGPGTSAAAIIELVEALDPRREPERLVLITRLGRDRVREVLPGLAAAVAATGARPVWLCDPVHGNTIRLADGRKTRVVPHLVAEVRDFVAVLTAAGLHPAGLHLESSPDQVTECVDEVEDLSGAGPVLPWYASACDPRLNPGQAVRVTRAFLDAFTRPAVVRP
ncbi:3-deoxy-7-phosphoheptulonate synthase [Actinokineospora baliensis]|uniref:3-deoxy-7-phosphoheptulonate synthase n=1 Tax=Actinokineospora baliensis TaxID=547056 RepID=UPI001956CA40|nr:3-deoxy-7-phosphoheptulonate synthase [Actinokineospora baliensis]MBM7774777.1 3-deoxy-7-phosphoheptulonate synthase [Actinokineospora baliensis]